MSEKKTTLREDLASEAKVVAEGLRRKNIEMADRAIGVNPNELIFRDMPRPEQLLPPVLEEFMDNGLVIEPSEARPSIEVPEYIFGFDAPLTNFVLATILDANDSRLRRVLAKSHTRALFRDDRYYQIIDDPNLYYREANSSDLPAFHCKAMLYLTAIGIMIYLKRLEPLQAAALLIGKGVPPRTKEQIEARKNRQPNRKQPQVDFASTLENEEYRSKNIGPIFNVHAYQYGTYVHCSDGDILRFQLDFLAVRRHFYDAFPLLMRMGWRPNSPSLIMYRRRYFQYMTPFLDWVDTMRYILKKSPTLSVATIFDRMINCHSEQLTLRDMLPMGHIMMEYFELRKLTKVNCPNSPYVGIYVGRKVRHNKEPQTQPEYRTAFNSENVVRPVLPHVCSPARRFLAHLYYYDKGSMSTLAQILSLMDVLLRMDFFSMHPLCKLSSIHLEPLIFQIYDFLWLQRKDATDKENFLRHEPWDTIKTDEESRAWYLRWDVLNCISLLFGVCQNALIKDFHEVVIDRIVTLIIEVLRSSEYLESVMSYSFYDTYFGLTTTVNCVPNLQSRCVLRVLKRMPLYLVGNLKQPVLIGLFSFRFWRNLGESKSLKDVSIDKITEYLVLRNRRISMKTAMEAGGEGVSATSAMGSNGAVTLFYREYDNMPEVTVEEEQAMDTDRNDNTRKEEEERKHVAEYKRHETDFRYSRVFTDSYFQATGRVRTFYDENTQLSTCKQRSETLFKTLK